MKRRLFIFIFVALFAVLAVFYGLDFFESTRDNLPLVKHMADFKPANTLVTSFNAKAEDPQAFLEQLLPLADQYRADVLLRMGETLNQTADETIAAPMIDLIYSKRAQLFPPYFVSDPAPRWDATGVKAYALKAQPGAGHILTIRNRFQDKPLQNLRQELVVPLAQLAAYQPLLGDNAIFAELYVLAPDEQSAAALKAALPTALKAVKIGDISSYGQKNQMAAILVPKTKGPPLGMAVFFLLSLLLIILAVLSLEVIEATREIAVRKMLGQGPWHIVLRLFAPLAGLLFLVFTGALGLTLLLLVKNWNRLALHFSGLVALLLPAFLLIMALILLIAYFYVQRLAAVTSVKRRSSLAFFLNFGWLMKMVLIILLCVQVLATLPNFNMVYGQWRAQQLYGDHILVAEPKRSFTSNDWNGDPSVTAQNPQIKEELFRDRAHFRVILDALQQMAHQLNYIYGNASTKGSQFATLGRDGKIVMQECPADIAAGSFQTTLQNNILDSAGQPVVFKTDPEQTTVLVPEKLDIGFVKEFGAYNYLLEKAKVIKIKDGQSVLWPNGLYLHNAIMFILTKEDLSRMGNLVDTPAQRERLAAAINKGEYKGVKMKPEDWSFREKPLIPRAGEDFAVFLRYLWLCLFLLIAFAVQSAHNAEVFFTDRALNLFLRYLHGWPFFARYAGAWVRATLPYLLSMILILALPGAVRQLMLVSYQGVVLDSFNIGWSVRGALWILGFLLFLDLLLQWLVIRRLQKHSVTRLKGER